MDEAGQQALYELKSLLGELYGDRLDGIYLYGSHARGEATDRSDIDVLAVLEGDVRPGREIGRMSQGVSRICLRHGVLLSVMPVPKAWFHDRKSPFYLNVRREAVLL